MRLCRPSTSRTAAWSAEFSGSAGKTCAGLSVMPTVVAPDARSARAARPCAEEQVVYGGEGGGRVLAPGSVHAVAVAEVGRAPRLVERGPGRHPVTETLVHGRRVAGEDFRRLAVGPAAPVLQVLRKVPVVERDDRVDALGQQPVDQAVVEVQPARVDRPGAVRLDPRPGDGEAVRLEAEVGHQRDVALPAVVVVARHVAGVAGVHPARRTAERVPDGRSAAAVGGRALDLVRGGGRTPNEARRKFEVCRHAFTP